MSGAAWGAQENSLARQMSRVTWWRSLIRAQTSGLCFASAGGSKNKSAPEKIGARTPQIKNSFDGDSIDKTRSEFVKFQDSVRVESWDDKDFSVIFTVVVWPWDWRNKKSEPDPMRPDSTRHFWAGRLWEIWTIFAPDQSANFSFSSFLAACRAMVALVRTYFIWNERNFLRV